MRRLEPADRPAAQHPRALAKPARAVERRHHRTRRATAVAADRARRQWLRSAIPVRRVARPAGRLLRPPVRRQWRRVLGAVRTDGRHLPHHLRAHLRRLLFPGFVRDHAGSFPRRRGDLSAHVPGRGSTTLHLSQSRRGSDSGGLARRPALHRAARRIQLSQGAQSGLQLPPAGRELVRGAQGQRARRDGRAGRRGGDREECQAVVAAAHRRRWQADPPRSAREDS